MGIFEIILLGFGLAMDATAVAISNGIVECKMRSRKIFAIAVCFSFFQGIMPIIGFYFGSIFADFVDAIDNYIVFIILSILGIRMISDGLRTDKPTDHLSKCKIVIQGLITSIDALMVGVTFAIFHVYIYRASLIISLITLFMAGIGVIIGLKFGKSLKHRAEILGGLILIILALKFLIEGLI